MSFVFQSEKNWDYYSQIQGQYIQRKSKLLVQIQWMDGWRRLRHFKHANGGYIMHEIV